MAGALRWVTAGDRGRELHGYLSDPSKPLIIIKCRTSTWDFTFTNHDGAGKVRVGNGCPYNPLHLIEAVWQQVEVGTAIRAAIEDDAWEAQFDPDAPITFSEDWA